MHSEPKNYKENRSELARRILSIDDKAERRRLLKQEREKGSYWIDYFSKRYNTQLDTLSLVETLGLKVSVPIYRDKYIVRLPDIFSILKKYEEDASMKIRFLKIHKEYARNEDDLKRYKQDIFASYLTNNNEILRLINSFPEYKHQLLKLQAIKAVCKDLYANNNPDLDMQVLKLLDSPKLNGKYIKYDPGMPTLERAGLIEVIDICEEEMIKINSLFGKIPEFLESFSNINKKMIETGCIPNIEYDESIITRQNLETNENQILLYHMTNPVSIDFIDRFGLLSSVKHNSVGERQWVVEHSDGEYVDRSKCVYAALKIGEIDFPLDGQSLLQLRVDIDKCFVGDHDKAGMVLSSNKYLADDYNSMLRSREDEEEERITAAEDMTVYKQSFVTLRFFLDFVEKNGYYPNDIRIPEVLIPYDVPQTDIRVFDLKVADERVYKN